MGNFGGHALPGSFFLLFGLWYLVQTWCRYWTSSRQRIKFIPTVAFPCPCLCKKLRNFPIDALIKIILTTIGAAIEIYTGSYNGVFVNFSNAQHVTMFMAFALTGVIDILYYFNVPLPPDMDYISNALAFSVEGILFHFHTHGRVAVELVIHQLLVYVVVASLVVTIAEMKYRNLMTALLRTYFIILQGTWFWQAAFLLYGNDGYPMLDVFDHVSSSITTILFCWHAGVLFVVTLLVGVITSCFFKGSKKSNDAVSYRRLLDNKTDDNSAAVSGIFDESDSDIEYNKPALLSR